MYRDRQGREIKGNEGQDYILDKLYRSLPGKVLLPLLISPPVSAMAGKFFDSGLSAFMVSGFVKRNHIDLGLYKKQKFNSYNDFFTREIREGEREFDWKPEAFCAPCDSKLSVYSISKDSEFSIKSMNYTMESLTRSRRIARQYEGGLLLVFRLTVDDYHHYAYVDDGVVTRNYHIPGVFHTVNPLAGELYPIYRENTRQFSIMRSTHFGNVLMMEVGALLVGRICNFIDGDGKTSVVRGQEKGMFEFGGSTVILAVEKDRIRIDDDILRNSDEGIETIVKQGERIGTAI
ncbi:MAG: phosphatidylserine decarboxylase [Lachnospiraceae bacterium]|nr:phosphatidylserine decarboxylase [Lachnospiraceae bacterium]